MNVYGWVWQRLRPAILARDGWRCWICGNPANTVDHVVALAEGGAPYDPANLRAACRPCNCRRGGELSAARRDTVVAQRPGFLTGGGSRRSALGSLPGKGSTPAGDGRARGRMVRFGAIRPGEG